MNANEIRQKFLDFQIKNGHHQITPAPLVLDNDPTTLFTGSGMQPLLPYLLGQPHHNGNRLTNSQPCLRLQDIEEIGNPRYTTVFEMLGNWSLGDYFKQEQIENFFTFLTQELKLNPEKIYVTCFIGSKKYGIPRDDESAQIWQNVFQKVGITAKIATIGSAENGAKRGIKTGERIFFYDDQENWWSRGGGCDTTPIGDPCGPDSEVFYDFGEDKQDIAKYGLSHPASDGARFMEIGNQVFMQYRRQKDGSFQELDKKNVDFGGGLERLTAATIGSFDVFQISLFKPIIQKLETLSHKSYENHTDEMRIIADHLRGAYLLAAEGLTPSNKTQGYALRRLIRRAILRALDLGIAQNFLTEITPIIAENYQTLSDNILTHRNSALTTLQKEEDIFRKTLNKGLKELRKMAQHSPLLTGNDLFKLQDTYGFPLELSVEECYRENIQLSNHYQTEFKKALTKQRQRSKTASKGMFKGGLTDHSTKTIKYHTACHLLLSALQKHISPQIHQKGSHITSERLRFDFNLDYKMSDEQLKIVENQVNAWITAKLPITFATYDKTYAKDQLKAQGEFWDKYPKKLTVYTIGNPSNSISCEVCGGPHVKNTNELGHFTISKESSISAGIRRIKAMLE